MRGDLKSVQIFRRIWIAPQHPLWLALLCCRGLILLSKPHWDNYFYSAEARAHVEQGRSEPIFQGCHRLGKLRAHASTPLLL